VFVDQDKVNRIQLVALDEGFLTIDSIYDVKHDIGNIRSLHRCLCELTNKSNALDVALQALCLLQLAIRKQDDRIKVESIVMNGKALRQLLKAMGNLKTAYTTETMAATLCLKTFEVCHVPYLTYLSTSV
jgi:hypothetical protein